MPRATSQSAPLRQRLEVIDRFPGLHFDHRLEAMPAIGRHQHEVGIERRGADANRRVLLVPGVHAGFVFPPKFRVEQPDQPVVLQLLADRPHQNRAQRAPPNSWISTT